MTNLYAEWKKLRDNVQSASARLYSEKNENTERKYEEALERLAQFEKENGIPLMADEADVKKMFCPQTNEEWFCALPTKDKAKFMCNIYEMGKNGKEYFMRLDKCVEWLKQQHTNEYVTSK